MSALSCQKAKSFLILIMFISYLSVRLSFYTCCQLVNIQINLSLLQWPVHTCFTYYVHRPGVPGGRGPGLSGTPHQVFIETEKDPCTVGIPLLCFPGLCHLLWFTNKCMTIGLLLQWYGHLCFVLYASGIPVMP